MMMFTTSSMDTFTDALAPDDSGNMQAHADAAAGIHDDVEPRSVLDDDSDGEEGEDYIDDDRSSSLSIPNESIDFDLVYSLHSFAATVDGQANVVKGDRLFLIDDSNSYWWLVRVLKTQEVGYIPAENIETPFERLARLNKHRNVDLASATQAEMQGDLDASQDRLRLRTGTQSPSPIPPARGRTMSRSKRRLTFTASMSVHRYAPAIWDEEDEEDEDAEFDVGQFMMSDPELAAAEEEEHARVGHKPVPMDVDDGMPWEDPTSEDAQAQWHLQDRARAMAQAAAASGNGRVPDVLQPGGPDREPQQHLSQQQQALMMIQQQQQQQQGQQVLTQLQPQRQIELGSKERLSPPDALRPSSSSPNSRQLDPANAPDIVSRKSLTPGVVRDDSSSALQREDERTRRLRLEEEEEASRKLNKAAKEKESKAPQPSSLSQQKLTKQRKAEAPKEEEDSGGRKRRGVFSGLFGGRKKDKLKDKNASVASFDSADTRASEESGKSSRPSHASSTEGVLSPNLASQQQQQQNIATRSIDIKATNSTSERAPQVSLHASQLRQHDQQQQALYQQYLKSSPSSPPEPTSHGLQTHFTVLGANSPGGAGASSGLGPPAPRQRPGSLILTSTSLDGAFPGVQQELSVIRIFAGKNLQTDATFKTALLNSSTVASDLVRQAIQRFRLPGGEDSSDYYLTVKQVEGGSSTVLHDHENPLVVFETLVNEAMEMPKVKRSSMGSISSISSNLSMHPAIKKLPMNDFTDDSAVKFYLNRKGEQGGVEESLLGHDAGAGGVENPHGSISSVGSGDGGEAGIAMLGDLIVRSPKSQFLSVAAPGSLAVSPERFTSPSIRFPLQLIIYREDLPDDMLFHPTTEAIVFKDHLRDSDLSTQVGVVNPNSRKKVFMFPRNVTVAEVIEMGLDRFGILEGVVDGGDEVEDKSVKRRSSPRVRYGLWVSVNGNDRELTPSSRVVDAFPRPPTFKSPSANGNNKRRSMDSVQLLGNMDDVQPEDPVFRLRRATSYRNSTSRHRMSAPLDEIALQRLHRESSSSGTSQASTDQTHTPHMYSQHHLRQNSQQQLRQQPIVQGAPDIGNEEHDPDHLNNGPKKQRSAQEIIAAQRAASRANQMAILSAQPNLLRGTDILLPDNALLRSSRYDSTEKMRYSYVEPDGETTYDISDIVEAEWRDGDGVSGQPSSSGDDDLLARVVVSNVDLTGVGGSGKNPPGLGANLVRVLSKIRDGKAGKGGDDSMETLGMASLPAQGMKDNEIQHDEERDSFVDDTVVVGGLAALGGGIKDYRRESSVPSVSEYSVDDSTGRSRSTTPGSAGFVSRMPGTIHGSSSSPGMPTLSSGSPGLFTSARLQQHVSSRSDSSVASSIDERALDRSSPISPRSNTTTPTGRPVVEKRRQPSLASVMSDTTNMSTSGFVTPPMYPYTPPPLSQQLHDSPKSFASVSTVMSAGGIGSPMGGGSPALGKKRRGGQGQPILPRDDFGISHMMTIIEYRAAQLKNEKMVGKEQALHGQEKGTDVDVVHERLFGKHVDLDSFHPEVKNIYASGFKMLEEMDKMLDSCVKPSIGAF